MGKPKPTTYAVWLGIFLAGVTLLRLWVAATLELSPDEAYYWSWSTQLAAGYYDHGPLVAWLIRLGTLLLGPTELGVRLLGIGCGVVTSWLVFALTRSVTENPKVAFWTALLLNLSPLFALGAVVHTPDAALVMFWALGLWFFLRAFRSGRAWDWAGVGAAVGLAALAKLTGFAFFGGLGLFLAWSGAGRQRLRQPGPVIALLAGMLVFLPSWLWNQQHAGGAFAYQFQRATANLAFSPREFGAFVGGQIGVVSPLLWLALLLFWLSGLRRTVRVANAEVFALWCLSAPLCLGLTLLSWVQHIEANWAAVAYLSALPGVAWAWNGGLWYPKHLRVWGGLAGALAFGLTALVHLQALWPFLPLAPAQDPTAKLRGWRQLAAEATVEARSLGAAIGSEGYGPVSELRFYAQAPILYEPSPSRRSQYDLWAPPAGAATVLFLQPRTTPTAPRLCELAEERWQLERTPAPDRWSRGADFRWWVCEQITPEQKASSSD